jgi:hypothetical protein
MGEYPLDPESALDLLDEGRRERLMQVTVKAGPADSRSGVISGHFGWGSLVLAVAGAGLREDGLVGVAARLEDVARRLAAEVGLAWVGLELELGVAMTAFPFRDDGRSLQVVSDLLDIVVFDAYPFQILGPGHMGRLRNTPEGAIPLIGGRFELALGELHEWIPSQPGAHLQRAEGRRILAACLPATSELSGVSSADNGHVRLQVGGQATPG